MKKVSAILLLLLYLSTFTEMHQLLRMPMLLTHYQEHQSQKADITFLDYLSQHYLDDDHADNRHHDLPFKHNHCEILHIVVAVVPGLTSCEFSSFSPTNIPFVSYQPQFCYRSATSSIWQPPRQPLL